MKRDILDRPLPQDHLELEQAIEERFTGNTPDEMTAWILRCTSKGWRAEVALRNGQELFRTDVYRHHSTLVKDLTKAGIRQFYGIISTTF